MRWLLAPFWNTRERRVRALVRIALQLGVFVAFSLLVQFVFQRVERAGPGRLLTHGALHLVSTLLVVASVWLGCRFLDRRAMPDLGLRISARWLIDAGFGAALGGLLMLGIFASESHFGWATYAAVVHAPEGLWRFAAIPVVVVAFLSVAVVEELIFRGYQLVNLAEGFRSQWTSPAVALLGATLFSSLAFGLAHASNPHAEANAAGNIALAGAMLAAGFLLTGELAIPIGLHFGWNFFQNLFGMPVSGQTYFSYGSLVQRTETGPDWITGGAFGPEAGMTGLTAMVAGTLIIFVYAHVLEGRIEIHRSLLGSGPSR